MTWASKCLLQALPPLFQTSETRDWQSSNWSWYLGSMFSASRSRKNNWRPSWGREVHSQSFHGINKKQVIRPKIGAHQYGQRPFSHARRITTRNGRLETEEWRRDNALRRENEEMREILYSYPQSSPSEGNVTKHTIVNKKEPKGSKLHSTTHHTNASYQAGGSWTHPFVDKIMNTELPLQWKGLNMERYDGTTDPYNHVNIYVTQVALYVDNDAIFYRVFRTSLKGATLSWFTHLQPHSIDNFETLVGKFITQFATSRPHHVGSVALINIRQEKGETLRTFVERFEKLTLWIQNLDLNVALHYLVTTLRPGPFAKLAHDLDELRYKAAKFM